MIPSGNYQGSVCDVQGLGAIAPTWSGGEVRYLGSGEAGFGATLYMVNFVYFGIAAFAGYYITKKWFK